jgi:hypothetical protein
MATYLQFIQLSLIKINDFKGVVIRVYHFNNQEVIHFLPRSRSFVQGIYILTKELDRCQSQKN